MCHFYDAPKIGFFSPTERLINIMDFLLKIWTRPAQHGKKVNFVFLRYCIYCDKWLFMSTCEIVYEELIILEQFWRGVNQPYTLRKKGSLGFYIWSIGFFTQLQRTFYAKKKFYNDKKEPFYPLERHKGSL